jgi:hypothetical protein
MPNKFKPSPNFKLVNIAPDILKSETKGNFRKSLTTNYTKLNNYIDSNIAPPLALAASIYPPTRPLALAYGMYKSERDNNIPAEAANVIYNKVIDRNNPISERAGGLVDFQNAYDQYSKGNILYSGKFPNGTPGAIPEFIFGLSGVLEPSSGIPMLLDNGIEFLKATSDINDLYNTSKGSLNKGVYNGVTSKLKDGGIPKLKSTNMKTGIQVKRLSQSIPKLSIGGTIANTAAATTSGLAVGGPVGAIVGTSALAGGLFDHFANKNIEAKKEQEMKNLNRKNLAINNANRLANSNPYGYNQPTYLSKGGIPRLSEGGTAQTAKGKFKKIELQVNSDPRPSATKAQVVSNSPRTSLLEKHKAEKDVELQKKASVDAHKMKYPTPIEDRSIGNIANLAALDVPRMTNKVLNDMVLSRGFYKDAGLMAIGDPIASMNMESRIKGILPDAKRFQEIENNNGIDNREIVDFGLTVLGGKAINSAAKKLIPYDKIDDIVKSSYKSLSKYTSKYIPNPIEKYITTPYKEGLAGIRNPKAAAKAAAKANAATVSKPATTTVSKPATTSTITPKPNVAINRADAPFTQPMKIDLKAPTTSITPKPKVVNLYDATNNPVANEKISWLTRQLNKLSKGGIPKLANGGVPEAISGGKIKKLDNKVSVAISNNPKIVDNINVLLNTPNGKTRAKVDNEAIINTGKEDVVIATKDTPKFLDIYKNVPTKLKPKVANMFAERAKIKQQMMLANNNNLFTGGSANSNLTGDPKTRTKTGLINENGFPIFGLRDNDIARIQELGLIDEGDKNNIIPANIAAPNPISKNVITYTDPRQNRSFPTTAPQVGPTTTPQVSHVAASKAAPVINQSAEKETPNVKFNSIHNFATQPFTSAQPSVNLEYFNTSGKIPTIPESKLPPLPIDKSSIFDKIKNMTPEQKSNAANITLGAASIINNAISYNKLKNLKTPELTKVSPILQDVNENATVFENQRNKLDANYGQLKNAIEGNASNSNNLVSKLTQANMNRHSSLTDSFSNQISDRNRIRNANTISQNTMALSNQDASNKQSLMAFELNKGLVEAGNNLSNANIATVQNFIDKVDKNRMDNKALEAIAIRYGIDWKSGDSMQDLLNKFLKQFGTTIQASNPTPVAPPTTPVED